MKTTNFESIEDFFKGYYKSFFIQIVCDTIFHSLIKYVNNESFSISEVLKE
jgi:hypothetical protein